MSSSWKSHGRSFNSLVKRNTSGVDTRANDRGEHRSDRDAIQVYYCPDASGSGKDATFASAQLEFGKCSFGVEASNNFIFNDAFFGLDASANIQFTDVSGGLGRAGLFFRPSKNTEDDEPQNILLTDVSGESLLIRLRPFWTGTEGGNEITTLDPSWNYPPQYAFANGIGCPVPHPNGDDALHPTQGGTLGAVTIDIGGGIGSNDNVIVSSFLRARQFAKAVGNPFAPSGLTDAVPAKNNTGYFWSDHDVWENYPKLGVACSIFGKSDASSCIVWQIEPKNEMTTDPHDISYNCGVGLPGYSDDTPIVDWTAAGDETMPGNSLHPHFGLTDLDRVAGMAGSFTHGRELVDISQNIVLKDTSGETLKFVLNVDNSYNTIEYDDDTYALLNYDPSWNTTPDPSGSLGTITMPFGTIFLDWKVGERNARRKEGNLLSAQENLSDLQRPNATDRANIFIRAVNRTGWGTDVSANGYYLEIDASTNPYDTSGGVILTQDYGGVSGNTAIEYDPDYDDSSATGFALPTDVSANRPANDPSSNYTFGGGVDGTDTSQNIILSDICGNKVQFVLNVDQTFDDPSGIHLYQTSVIVPMDNSGNRATGAERAEQLALAINKTNFSTLSTSYGLDSSSVDLFLVGTTNGDEKVQIYQEYPGVSGNMLSVDISYNTPTWEELFPAASPNQVSSENYPLKLQRDMDCSNCFLGGLDPIDASQTIVMTASGENLTTTMTFYLDVERQNETDAAGAWETSPNEYSYYVPVGKGLGRRTSEIMVSDEMRATRFERALNECSTDPDNLPASGGGDINFLNLTVPDIEEGSVIYTIDTENVPLPARFAATIGGGTEGQYGESYPPSTTQQTRVNIESLTAGAGSNSQIFYTPDPNKPGDEAGYDTGKIYPLIEKTTNKVIYNFDAIASGTDSRLQYDELVRTQNSIRIVGGRHTLVYGDQDKNEIIIESIIDISSNANGGQSLSIPVWELGKGAGTTNLNPKYSIQAINPSNSSGVTGAGADYSIAGGFETKALGQASVSLGTYCISAGDNSFTMGETCETSLNGEGSIAIGLGSKCNNSYSCAFGYRAETGLTATHPSAPPNPLVNNIEFGTSEIVFSIGAPKEDLSLHNNIIEIDSNGNIWSQALGNLSATVTPILREKTHAQEFSGLYVYYGEPSNGVPLSGENGRVQALGARSFAIGFDSITHAKGSFVDGSGCEIYESSDFSAIFGEGNTIESSSSHSFISGKSNISRGTSSAIFGEKCSAANYSFAAGSACDASGDYSIAMGVNNQSPGFYSVALGGANYAFGESSLALGRNSRALGIISGAIGCHSVAQGGFSYAIGRECKTGPDASNSYCLGAECTVTGIGSVALGYNSISEGNYCFVGSGGYANIDGSGSIAIGYKTRTLEKGAVSIGYDSSANSPYSVAIGHVCDVSGSWAVGLGYNSQCSGDYSFSVGKSCLTKDNYGVALGKESSAYTEGSVAVGINCVAKSCRTKEWDATNAQTSIALGKGASTSNYAPWVGTTGSEKEPRDTTYQNAVGFRGSKKGIVLAIGASGEAIEYKPNMNANNPGTSGDQDEVSSGNIFELYGDGTMWTSSMGVVVNPADASAVKMVFAERGDDTTPLIKVNAGNQPKEFFLGNQVPSNIGIGSVIIGNDSTALGNYSFSSGHKNSTDASYCVAMGYDCSAAGISSFALGYECDASNNYSVAFGYGGSTKTSSSGGDISDNDLIFAIGVSAEYLGDVLSGGPDPSNSHYSGNVFEIDQNGSVWTKALGTLSSTIPALGSVPIGGIIPFAGSQSLIAPTNWLWCDGQSINHVDEPKYAALFLVIGTTYTAPNPAAGGFQVPNLQMNWPMGNVDMGNTLTDPNNVNQTGDVSDIGHGGNIATPTIAAGAGNPLVMRWLIRYA